MKIRRPCHGELELLRAALRGWDAAAASPAAVIGCAVIGVVVTVVAVVVVFSLYCGFQ